MKIKNPNFIDAGQARLTKYAAEIDTYITGLPVDVEFLSFDKIKADILAMNLPGVTASDITQVKLMNICQAKGIEIVI